MSNYSSNDYKAFEIINDFLPVIKKYKAYISIVDGNFAIGFSIKYFENNKHYIGFIIFKFIQYRYILVEFAYKRYNYENRIEKYIFGTPVTIRMHDKELNMEKLLFDTIDKGIEYIDTYEKDEKFNVFKSMKEQYLINK